jgi:hypothetical protein
MTINHGHESADERNPRNPSVEFDKSDLSARGILTFLIVLGVLAIVLNLVVVGMYVGMTKFADLHEKELSPLAPQTITPRAGILQNTANINIQKFPEPRLQNDDTSDMTRFLAKEAEAQTAQPWQDAQGNVHLPIDQAMKIVGSRLPVRPGATAVPNYPGAGLQYSYPTAANDATAQPKAGEVENSPPAK